MTFVDDVFGPTGLMADHFPGYEPRANQIDLAHTVFDAIQAKKHVLAEGPCGIGKSASYITSAIHAAAQGKRVIIATANIALQEQLYRKDLPMMKKVTGKDFSFALVKGLNNYLCTHKLDTAVGQGQTRSLFSNEGSKQFRQIEQWAEETKTGDMSELPFVPNHQVWSSVSTTADECLKKDCPHIDTCKAMQSRRAAFTSSIVVTNYHMLFADFAIRSAGGVGVLPNYHVLIMDEAHEAPDIARDFFGFSLSQRNVELIASMVKSELGDDKLSRDLRDESDVFFNFLIDYSRSDKYKVRLRTANFCDASSMVNKLERVITSAQLLVEQEDDEKRQASLKNFVTRAENAKNNIEEAVSLTDQGKVYWIDVSKENAVKLCGKSISSGAKMREHVYEKGVELVGIESIIAMSATMTTGEPTDSGAFDFIRAELGAPDDVITVAKDSPFDFQKQALVVVPKNLPDPKNMAFPQAVADATNMAIKACNGRTLGLFTSYKNLNATYDKVKHCGYQVLKQGDLPRQELTRIFREDLSSVLLGTDSFWTGVDVPGEALTCLVIDRLPFTNPSDPVCDAISERDKSAFMNYHVPKAIIKFKQGIGRLIRAKTDTGVIVILDSRILGTRWGKMFWNSLPPGINARDTMDAVDGFMKWSQKTVKPT